MENERKSVNEARQLFEQNNISPKYESLPARTTGKREHGTLMTSNIILRQKAKAKSGVETEQCGQIIWR